MADNKNTLATVVEITTLATFFLAEVFTDDILDRFVLSFHSRQLYVRWGHYLKVQATPTKTNEHVKTLT
jgi:hypothetical protein